MKLPNKLYDILKWVSLIGLTATGTVYKAISVIWGLPYGDQVVATCSALSAFVGAIIGISTIAYNKEDNE